MKYFLCNSSLSDEKWHVLLKRKFKEAEFIEFNTLYNEKKLNSEILALNKYLVHKDKKRKNVLKWNLL